MLACARCVVASQHLSAFQFKICHCRGLALISVNCSAIVSCINWISFALHFEPIPLVFLATDLLPRSTPCSAHPGQFALQSLKKNNMLSKSTSRMVRRGSRKLVSRNHPAGHQKNRQFRTAWPSNSCQLMQLCMQVRSAAPAGRSGPLQRIAGPTSSRRSVVAHVEIPDAFRAALQTALE